MSKLVKTKEEEKKNLMLGFFMGIFAVFAIAALLEEKDRKAGKRLRQILEDSGNGFENDKKMLVSDWERIHCDFDKSYKDLKQQFHYE